MNSIISYVKQVFGLEKRGNPTQEISPAYRATPKGKTPLNSVRMERIRSKLPMAEQKLINQMQADTQSSRDYHLHLLDVNLEVVREMFQKQDPRLALWGMDWLANKSNLKMERLCGDDPRVVEYNLVLTLAATNGPFTPQEQMYRRWLAAVASPWGAEVDRKMLEDHHIRKDAGGRLPTDEERPQLTAEVAEEIKKTRALLAQSQETMDEAELLRQVAALPTADAGIEQRNRARLQKG